MVTRVPTRMITTTGVQAGSYTAADITVNEAGQITSAASNSVVVSGGGGGPKITSIAVTNGSWTVLDDTAVSVNGGYIKITGSGFTSGCQVVIGTLVATSVSFVSSTEVRAQVPAQSAGTYTVYLTNSDGGVAIRVNGINYSNTPTWTTTSPLPGGAKDAAISIQLAASSNSTITYSLASGSTLPSGLTLNSSGLLSGTVTGITVETTYNFTVVATDQENQDTPQAFQVTITVNDPYYEYVTLHLPGTGTNLATNNQFLDSSTNNFTITRNGNTTQGTFSPFSQTGWGNYFDGASDYLTLASNAAFSFGTGSFTYETWFYSTGTTSAANVFYDLSNANGAGSFSVFTTGGVLYIRIGGTGNDLTYTLTSSWINTWHHLAVVRNGTTLTVYLDGTSVATGTRAQDVTQSTPYIGDSINALAGYSFGGYLSNTRVVKGTAVYTGNFTPPTSPLTAISGTSLLTCQSNRFRDASSNNFTITTSGSPTVVAFSPFNPTESWSAATNGGSGYFDGTGDSLTLPSNWNGVTFGTGAFSFEVWVYQLATNTDARILGASNFASDARIFFSNYGSTGFGIATGSAWQLTTSTPIPLNQWTHVVVCRSGGTLSIFFNGVRQATSTNNNNLGLDTSYFIGAGNWYLSNLRIVKNSTAYDPTQTTLTVPTSPPTAITNTSLLLNFTNAGIYDATGKNDLETVGSAQISTTQSKFGGSSMYFDGTGDWLKTPSSTLWQFGTGDFTIEFWWYPNSLATYQQILSVIDNVGVTGAGQFAITYNTSLGLRFYINAGATTIDQGSTSGWSAGQWYYIAAVRNGNTLTLYRNGTSIASGSVTGITIGANVPVYIGGEQYTPHSNNCYLQDVRITKGYARTVTTSPTAAFPTL